MLLADLGITLETSALPGTMVRGLYVHVPFCFHKCHYCDFYSITRQTPERMDRFVDLVLREADYWIRNNATDRPGGPVIQPRTIFFGGGTPSLLSVEQMERLLVGLGARFDLSSCDEWTMEANPATVSLEYCQMVKSRGVNRMSLGAQSFDRAELDLLERHHDPEDVPASLRLAREAGFERLNVDLIYAVPGQTLERWMASLESAIELGTEHLSCYGLTYEPNTPLAVRKRLGQFRAAAPELEIEMMRATRRRLGDAGLGAYEISNYSKPGAECQHNLLYWNGGDYIGLGPSAASHVQGWRWRNRPHLGEWESAIERGNLPAIEVERLSARHRAGELAMLSLRLSRGLVFGEFAERTGFDALEIFREPIAQLSSHGLIEVTDLGIFLGERGLAVADGIAGEFLAAAGR
ncbi:MAG: radical SAM family heme chaperone HemW [Planctomycetota bacterium]|nr:radical SAM family heme chaperone HemW [Planctomycetota bacterium]